VAAATLLVRNLHYRYPDGREALRGVNFEVASGACVGLVGPNGAGKSTLLWHLNGLLPSYRRAAPTHDHTLAAATKSSSPSVWIDGMEVNEKNGSEIRRRVGLLFQDPDDQLFCPRVLDDVAFGPLNLGTNRVEARRLALECLERVGLREVADRPPFHLSYGERKRVCLAGLLACSPSLLALDEPSANLDPRGRRLFINLIRHLPSTKLIATHDLELVVELCEHTLILDAGLIVAEGPTRKLLCDAELLEAHGLEVPATLALRRG
jgi:energy-coupling factor transporter ATP-binding protein EcfA2